MSETIKFDICCAARILFRAGLSAGNAGHLSVSIGSNQMLVNRFGPSFATLTPKDILSCDYQGRVLEGQGAVNETIQLHGVIHRYNPASSPSSTRTRPRSSRMVRFEKFLKSMTRKAVCSRGHIRSTKTTLASPPPKTESVRRGLGQTRQSFRKPGDHDRA
jgi:hypothetical protein